MSKYFSVIVKLRSPNYLCMAHPNHPVQMKNFIDQIKPLCMKITVYNIV